MTPALHQGETTRPAPRPPLPYRPAARDGGERPLPAHQQAALRLRALGERQARSAPAQPVPPSILALFR